MNIWRDTICSGAGSCQPGGVECAGLGDYMVQNLAPSPDTLTLASLQHDLLHHALGLEAMKWSIGGDATGLLLVRTEPGSWSAAGANHHVKVCHLYCIAVKDCAAAPVCIFASSLPVDVVQKAHVSYHSGNEGELLWAPKATQEPLRVVACWRLQWGLLGGHSPNVVLRPHQSPDSDGAFGA